MCCLVLLGFGWDVWRGRQLSINSPKKMDQISRKYFPKMPKIGQNRSENVFMCFYSFCSGDSVTHTGEWEIWSVSGRLPDSPGSWRRRIILVDSQPHSLPEAGRFICNRISLNGVECSTTLYFSLLENNNFSTCIMLMIICES